jgi:hypothetical protein
MDTAYPSAVHQAKPCYWAYYTGDFLFDTGSDLAMILDSLWMRNQQFPRNLKVIKTLTFSDGAGRKYESSVVWLPSLSLNGFVLDTIPTSPLG